MLLSVFSLILFYSVSTGASRDYSQESGLIAINRISPEPLLCRFFLKKLSQNDRLPNDNINNPQIMDTGLQYKGLGLKLWNKEDFKVLNLADQAALFHSRLRNNTRLLIDINERFYGIRVTNNRTHDLSYMTYQYRAPIPLLVTDVIDRILFAWNKYAANIYEIVLNERLREQIRAYKLQKTRQNRNNFTKFPGLYFEGQELALCGLHAINNVFQEFVVSVEDMEDFAFQLEQQEVALGVLVRDYTFKASIREKQEDFPLLKTEYRCANQKGYYNVDVVRLGIQSHGFYMIQIGYKRLRSLSGPELLEEMTRIVATNDKFIIHSEKKFYDHWYALTEVNGTFYELDSESYPYALNEAKQVGDYLWKKMKKGAHVYKICRTPEPSS